MRCDNCGHEDTRGVKFCTACGAQRSASCPACGRRLPEAAKFCSECGAAVAGGARPTTTRAHTDALPDGERRQLSVMFCDLVGSTALSHRLDNETLHEVVRAYQERASQVIGRYEGHIAQYLGDGLLVYFGYPVAHEDDAERAVRAGHEIPTAIAALNDRLEREHGVRLEVRVGIHTGPVVVGTMGGPGRQETLALGDTTNVAARLEAAAEAGTVVISGVTQALIPGLFVTESLGTPTLKGVTEPVEAFRVLQPSGVRSRLEVSGRLTPMVGREQEVALLFDRWEQVEEGEGQAVLVSGEAGVGKSRLFYAMRQRMADIPHTWLECRCSPYSGNSAFQPMIELVRQGLGFTESDSPAVKLRRLEIGLAFAGLSPSDIVPLLAPLLAIPLTDRYRAPAISQELLRKRTMESFVAWILALGDRQPVLFLVEDLHWCDPSTLELLTLLLAQIPTARVLTVLAFRPEFKPPWPARSHVRPLALGRMRRRQLMQMVKGVTAGRALPESIVTRLVERADGVPLYVEQLTKMILESGKLVEREDRYELTGELHDLAIPPTLQDSLMARLDRQREAKQIAQVAAALGREFPYRLLADVAAIGESALRQGLGRLVDAELLYQRGVLPDAIFTFKHALIQDTAYDSLLKRKRQQLHGRIAEALERDFPQRALREPELVGHHYDRAGRVAEAIPYYQRAGDEARARSSNAEAIAHLERGVALTQLLDEERARTRHELGLQLSLGGAKLEFHGFAREETRQAWERARVLAEKEGNPAQLAEALIGLSMFHQTRSELDAAIGFGDQLIALGRNTGGKEHLFAGYELLGNAKFWQGRFAECVAHYGDAIEIFDPKRDASFAAVGGFGPGLSSWALWLLGYPDQAAARAEEMVARARALAYPYGVAFALMVTSALFMMRREWKKAARYASECIEVSARDGFPLWQGITTTVRALATACDRGKDSLDEVMDALGLLMSTRQKAGTPLTMWQLARIHQEGGRAAEAQSAVELALKASEIGDQRFWDAELQRMQGELVRSADAAKAEARFRGAIETARGQKARSFELRAAASLADLLRARGDNAAARALLTPVYEAFTEGLDTPDLKDARALLDTL